MTGPFVSNFYVWQFNQNIELGVSGFDYLGTRWY